MFVYGTLRRGQVSEVLLAAARFIRLAETAPGWTLVDLGDYPALIAEGDVAVSGELYEVEPALLGTLDLHEGCPDLYQRRQIELEDGSMAEAYTMTAGQVVGSLRIRRWP